MLIDVSPKPDSIRCKRLSAQPVVPRDNVEEIFCVVAFRDAGYELSNVSKAHSNNVVKNLLQQPS